MKHRLHVLLVQSFGIFNKKNFIIGAHLIIIEISQWYNIFIAALYSNPSSFFNSERLQQFGIAVPSIKNCKNSSIGLCFSASSDFSAYFGHS